MKSPSPAVPKKVSRELISGSAVEKSVSVLSGGERTRLRLAKMLFSGANVLLLDEPTNHLDIASRATLETAACDYEGTMVFVSHDRFFLDAVATRVVEIKDGRIRSFPGNYTDYCHALKAMGETSPLIGASVKAPSAKPATQKPVADKPKSDASKKKSAPADQNGSAKSAARENSKADQKEQNRLKKLVTEIEKQITGVETRLAQIEIEIAKPEIYRDYTKCNPLVEEKKNLERQHVSYLEQWDRYTSTLQS